MNISDAKSYSTKTNARKAALRLLTKHVAIERVAIINGQPFARWFLIPEPTREINYQAVKL